jgi:hypothetical protein
MSNIQRSVGSRPCHREILPPITVRANVPTTPYPHLRQYSDRRPPHTHQLPKMTLLYTRTLRFSLMMTLRDVDLHRPATRRRRRVELSNPVVHIPSVTHQYRDPNTHRTNTCLQSYQRNHHCRDCLYNGILYLLSSTLSRRGSLTNLGSGRREGARRNQSN